jgi:hypothetical protein
VPLRRLDAVGILISKEKTMVEIIENTIEEPSTRLAVNHVLERVLGTRDAKVRISEAQNSSTFALTIQGKGWIWQHVFSGIEEDPNCIGRTLAQMLERAGR